MEEYTYYKNIRKKTPIFADWGSTNYGLSKQFMLLRSFEYWLR